MDDLPDFLGGEPAPAPQASPAPETAAPAAEAPASEGPARGPDGKFAAASPEPAPAAAPAPAALAVDAQGHVVPLATFLDTRDRLTVAEKEAKELREWRAQQEAAARRQPVPDRETDPAAYEAHQRAAFDARLYEQARDMSHRLAIVEHGPQVVDAAFNWGVQRCDTDPFFNEKVRASKDPVGMVVAEWRREQALAKVGDPAELDAFLAWKATQAGAAPAPGQPTPQAAPPAAIAAPRQSLAASPSAGAHAEAIPRDGEAAFGAMFGQ
jgi:hypothetical protein